MEVLKAIILGIIQGLTEFLPVSSSGHLELGKALLNIQLEESLQFSIAVHAATSLSTIVIFRKQIMEIFKDLFAFQLNDGTRFAFFVIISMIPVAIVGLFFKDEVEALFDGNTQFVGFMLILTGFLLLSTLLASTRKGGDLNPLSAFLIGIAQAIAVLPGISRSGSTISAALLCGVNREKAAAFSFLMAVPPILGITLLDLKDAVEQGAGDVQFGLLIAGFAAAFLTGLVACRLMVALVKKGKIQYFAYYCFAVGLIAVFFT